MKFYKDFKDDDYDIAIFGLGYESRAIWIAKSSFISATKKIAIGYKHHTDVFSYEKNRNFYEKNKYLIKELIDAEVNSFLGVIFEEFNSKRKLNVVIDITVMSRHRLATIIWFFLTTLEQGSTITITYCLSKFTPSPEITPPVKEIGCIIQELNGFPSDIGSPTALLLSLGYEQNKALGAVNFIDPESVYAFIPRSEENKFEDEVLIQNQDLLNDLQNNKFYYNVHQPYSTYLDLKSVALDILKFQKPIFLPLGPKIVAALAVILGKDLYPQLPVWRVSSNGCEEPADRISSGHKITFTVEI